MDENTAWKKSPHPPVKNSYDGEVNTHPPGFRGEELEELQLPKFPLGHAAGPTDRVMPDDREVTIEWLKLLNSEHDTRELMRKLTGFLRRLSGCSAVGIRLRDGEDFPYYETRGFPEEFVLAENKLCAVDQQGELIRDSDGNAVLECMCGNIICGRFDPSMPFFTEGGSFWTNSTTELLASTSEADRKARTRNRCNGEGYESVALLPLRYGKETLGLLQLNDKREGRFTPQLIRFFEGLADSAALALAHRRGEEERASLAKFPSENPSPVLRIAGDGTILYANDATGPLLAVKGSGVGQAAPGRWCNLVTDALTSNTRQRAEVEHEGRIFWFSIVPVSEEGYANLYARDVTEQTWAERALRESEETFRRLFDESPLGAAVVSTDLRYLRVNRALCEITGYSEEELVSRPFTDITHPDDVGIGVEDTGRLIAGEIDQYQMEKRYIRKNGTAAWARLHIRAIRDADERILYYLPIIEDITDQKRAEHLLARYAESVVEKVPAMVVTMDHIGNIERVNKFTLDLTGCSEEELRGAGWFETVIAPEDRQRLLELMRRAADGRPVQGTEVAIIAKDRREILTRWYVSILRDDENNIAGFVAIGTDITEIRQKEEQLRHAAKMEAIGRLTGGIAHNFNNYLAAIKGYSALLLNDLAGDNPARSDVEEIFKAAEGAARLTKQLMAFGRKAIVSPQVIGLNRVLDEMTESLKLMLGEDVDLSIRQGAGLGNIEMDPGQVQQIVMNLAINARDAMPHGGRLIIETENIECDTAEAENCCGTPPGRYVRLSVSDTGAGMDKETLQRIFEPFFTTKPEGLGTGLGLATVHGIVEQSGGNIGVESEFGRGTTFRIYLPPVEAPEEAPELPPRQRAAGGTETLLVVEDEEHVRSFIVKALGRAGFTILDTGSPREALSMAEDHGDRIHMLISDVIMPGMSGPELAKNIQVLRPGMPVLYMSGYTEDAISFRSDLEKDTELLTKPFAPEELCGKVREMLDSVCEKK